ncbi:MAG TPA: Zn-ribbon domain-containing OB-fold protein [Acidimicrobiales bacterium]|nr:Zn-ribbon domain-containing OB-fold protein [Acidimicrobiales bacterium]
MDRRPRPEPDATTAFYWEAASHGKLTLQRCRSCRWLQFPPDVCCVHCQAEAFDHAELSGRGTVFTFAVVDRALHEGFVDALPYIVALVELEEQAGLRVLANIIDAEPRDVSCGMAVEATFEVRGDVVLPQFRPAGRL